MQAQDRCGKHAAGRLQPKYLTLAIDSALFQVALTDVWGESSGLFVSPIAGLPDVFLTVWYRYLSEYTKLVVAKTLAFLLYAED